MKFRFIKESLVPPPCGGFAVVDCCRVLGVSHSGYYRWLRSPVSKRMEREAELVEEIRVEYKKNRRVYGAPRIHDALVKRGRRVNRKTVAKAMRKAGIRAKTAKKFRVLTTNSNHAYPIAPNPSEIVGRTEVLRRRTEHTAADRHHLRAPGPGIPVSRRSHGRVEPKQESDGAWRSRCTRRWRSMRSEWRSQSAGQRAVSGKVSCITATAACSMRARRIAGDLQSTASPRA